MCNGVAGEHDGQSDGQGSGEKSATSKGRQNWQEKICVEKMQKTSAKMI